MSAYEYFQKRFGRPARVYAAVAFTLAHFSKMGFVLYLMALNPERSSKRASTWRPGRSKRKARLSNGR